MFLKKLIIWLGITQLILLTDISWSETYLKIYQQGKQYYYPVVTGSRLTFPLINGNNEFQIFGKGVQDTLTSSLIDSFQVVIIQRLVSFEVAAGNILRKNIPVMANLDISFKNKNSLKLVEVIGRQRIPVPFQLENSDSLALWWILSGITNPGVKRVFELEGTPYTQPISPLKLSEEGDYLKIKWNSNTLMSYVTNRITPLGLVDTNYLRNGYLGEIYSPTDQNLLTADGTPGHEHHRGLFMAWNTMIYEGRALNLFASAVVGPESQGAIVLDSFDVKQEGPVYTGFKAHHYWKEYQGGGHVLEEKWDLKVFNLAGPSEGFWVFDLTITQWPGTNNPVTIDKWEYGGLNLKLNDAWKPNINIVTSEGTTGAASHKTKAKWNGASGLTNGKRSSISIFSHPKNLNHQEPCQNYPHLAYIGYTTPQNNAFTMTPGNQYEFRYRFYVNEGDIDVIENNLQWENFGNPPVVTSIIIP